MKPKVILYSKLPDDLRLRLENACDVHHYSLSSSSDQEFKADLLDTVGIIGSGMQVDRELLNQAPELKFVSNISVGYNNLDIEELNNRGIMATNTPDVLTDTTADTIFALLLSTARRVPEMDHYVKEGKWQDKITPELFGIDVHHKTLGIIGMGRIGRAIADRGHHGFKMNILYHNRSRDISAEQELEATYVSLDHLLQHSDFVCMMVPLKLETENMIGKREFQLMKKSAIFINGSRGQLVDESALIEALENKDIRSAGLDVYQKEPINDDSPLLQMSHIVTLPHIGSATAETRYEMAKLAVDNLITAVLGEIPASLINKEVL